MQILLNQKDLQAAVIAQVQDLFTIRDDQSLHVDLTDEGAIVTVLSPGESHEDHGTNEGSAGNEDRPKRTRRTKAQIEADRQAEEDAKKAAAAQAEKTQEAVVTETKTEEVEDPKVTPEEEEDISLTLPDEQQAAQEVVETAEPVEEQAQEEVQQKEEEPAAPVRSLFANLRQPRNS